VGFDPCLDAKEKDIFSEYSEVSVEFHLKDKKANPLHCYFCIKLNSRKSKTATTTCIHGLQSLPTTSQTASHLHT
jgi:hypothetical protein